MPFMLILLGGTMKKNNPPDTIYLQWYGDNVYGDSDVFGEPGEVTWCTDEVNNNDPKYLLATPEREVALKLLRALEANMRWIGAPPTDPHSYDSAREHAWKLGMRVRSEIHEKEKLL